MYNSSEIQSLIFLQCRRLVSFIKCKYLPYHLGQALSLLFESIPNIIPVFEAQCNFTLASSSSSSKILTILWSMVFPNPIPTRPHPTAHLPCIEIITHQSHKPISNALFCIVYLRTSHNSICPYPNIINTASAALYNANSSESDTYDKIYLHIGNAKENLIGSYWQTPIICSLVLSIIIIIYNLCAFGVSAVVVAVVVGLQMWRD